MEKNKETINNNVEKKDQQKDPQEEKYDYELQTWDRDEWGRSWCKWSYKPWIYGK